MSSGVILLQRPYVSIIIDSKAGDNRCGSGLVLIEKLTGTVESLFCINSMLLNFNIQQVFWLFPFPHFTQISSV